MPNNIGSLSVFGHGDGARHLRGSHPAFACHGAACVGPATRGLRCLGCLAQALPGKVQAESAGAIWMLMFNSAHGRVSPELLVNAAEYSVLAIGLGGIGGRPGKDGLACVAFPSGIGGIPIEIIEGQCPLWFEEKQFLPDCGGDGEWRGGLSQRFVVRNREATPFTISAATFDRIKNAAQGREGGKPGSLGVARLGSGTHLPDKGVHLVPAGDALIVELPGGGGFGDPSKRKPELRDAGAR